MKRAAHHHHHERAPDLLRPQEVVADRWRIKKKIGQGGFGQVYSCHSEANPNLTAALKVEAATARKQLLRAEIGVLKGVGDDRHVPSLLDSGRTSAFSFVVMRLLGRSLSAIRKSYPDGLMATATALRYGSQMLEALRFLHSRGFVHRDVKPSNYAVDDSEDQVLLIDFGLARKYLAKGGQHRTMRVKLPGFRGTARYASLGAHCHQDLSRRDDLWSFFFSVLELIRGSLPWSKEKDKIVIADAKRQFLSRLAGLVEEDELSNRLPGLGLVLESIARLKFEDRPDYEFIAAMLRKMRQDSEAPAPSPGTDPHTESLLSTSLRDAVMDSLCLSDGANQSSSMPVDEGGDDVYEGEAGLDAAFGHVSEPVLSSDERESTTSLSCIEFPARHQPAPPPGKPPGTARNYRKRRYCHLAQASRPRSIDLDFGDS